MNCNHHIQQQQQQQQHKETDHSSSHPLWTPAITLSLYRHTASALGAFNFTITRTLTPALLAY
jgi:hypothetical protein